MTKLGRFLRSPYWRFATHNVQELPLHRATIPHTITRALDGSDVVLWQELSDDFAEQVLARHQHYEHDLRRGVHNDARISVLKPLRFVPGGGGRVEFQTHRAGVSHERFISFNTVRGFPGAPDVVVSSRHYWPGAFNPTRTDRAMRRDEWQRGLEADLKLLTDTARRGLPQVAGGDYNRLDNPYPDRIEAMAVHHFRSGLDHLFFIDGATHVWRFPRLGTRRVIRNTESDHHVLIVRARLVPRR